jgi:uncharacterized lipoprotein YddW (UPF0748 family)
MPTGQVAVRGGVRVVVRAAAGLLALATLTGGAIAQPVVIEDIIRNTPGGQIRGFVATVDLTDPSVEIVVSQGNGTAGQTTLQTTPAFRTANSCKVAINANFFGTVNASTASVIGLCVTNGVVVSPARQFGAQPDPVITFDANRVATIGNIASTVGVWDAVAGVGPSNTDSDPGTMLLIDGANTGATARVSPATREPRTAVGVNQAGTRLYMMVIDGRQATWSVGVTLSELGDLMLEKGVWRAVNLDGGGSSAFSYLNDAGTVVNNRPSDGSARSVAVNLGIKLNPPAAVTDRVTRPIRGIWLRPTGVIADFENVMGTLAPLGIQDVFLETLYHGRDTARNNLSQFPHRFSNDYLALCIASAARYGVRVHAWCETGYLDFGSSPSALLAANPDWVVKHVSVARNEAINPDPCTTPNTLTGDQVNQRFVNLGNPGVRTALSSYFTSLATNYPGLEGIQADYHFFPLGNPPGNANDVAPWYDNWTLANYRDAGGSLVNPLPSATNCTGAVTYNSGTGVVNTGAHSNWINWNRGNVTEALVILRQSVEAVSSSPLFSAVSFGNWSAAVHLSKMIDLPNWGNRSGAEAFFIMAYQTSTANITNELNLAKAALPGRRVVSGLANLVSAPTCSPTARPSVLAQLQAMKTAGLEDFCWFEGNTFVSNACNTQATMRSDLQTWINSTGASGPTPLQGDITATGTSNGRDDRIDARDLAWFNSVYTGTPVPRTAANDRCDLNRDATIDAADAIMLTRQWRRYHFGDDLVVDARDVQACINAFNPGPMPVPNVLNLWDLNGDGAVNYLDQVIVHANLTVPMPPDLDVNGDGAVNVLDVYAYFNGTGRDVNRDGVINAADLVLLLPAVRANEVNDTTSGRR